MRIGRKIMNFQMSKDYEAGGIFQIAGRGIKVRMEKAPMSQSRLTKAYFSIKDPQEN